MCEKPTVARSNGNVALLLREESAIVSNLLLR